MARMRKTVVSRATVHGGPGCSLCKVHILGSTKGWRSYQSLTHTAQCPLTGHICLERKASPLGTNTQLCGKPVCQHLRDIANILVAP